MARARSAGNRNLGLVSAQAPVVFRATMSGLSGPGMSAKKKRHHAKRKAKKASRRRKRR